MTPPYPYQHAYWLKTDSDGIPQQREPVLASLYHSFMGFGAVFFVIFLMGSTRYSETGTFWFGLMLCCLGLAVRTTLTSQHLFRNRRERLTWRPFSVVLAPYMIESTGLGSLVALTVMTGNVRALYTHNGSRFAAMLLVGLALVSVFLAPVCGAALGSRMALTKDPGRLQRRAVLGLGLWFSMLPVALVLHRALPYDLKRSLAFPLVPVLMAVMAGFALVWFCVRAEVKPAPAPEVEARVTVWPCLLTGLLLPLSFDGGVGMIAASAASGYALGVLFEGLRHSLPRKHSGFERQGVPQCQLSKLTWMMLSGALAGPGCCLSLSLLSYLEIADTSGLSPNDAALLGIGVGFMCWLGSTLVKVRQSAVCELV